MTALRRATLLAALFAAPLATPLAAQASPSPLAGTWQIEYAAGMRVEDGVPTPLMAKGTLVITAQGDSLVASLKTVPPPGLPERPAARFAARTPAGATVTFVQRSQVMLNLDGEQRTAEAVSTWVLTADGGRLSGTFERRVEGMDMPGAGPTPVSGTRDP